MKTSSPAANHALPHADDELMSVTEVATLVRVPVATVRYRRHFGTGPHGFRVGRSVRYWHSDVIHWLDKSVPLSTERQLTLASPQRIV